MGIETVTIKGLPDLFLRVLYYKDIHIWDRVGTGLYLT